MTLDEVRVLDADTLNDEQKQILIAHKEELSSDEQTKFATVLADNTDGGDTAGDGDEGGEGEGTEGAGDGGEGEGVEADNKNNKGAGMTDEEKEAAQIQADIKSGAKVLMDAKKVEAMETQLTANTEQLKGYRKAEITASVGTHLKRGAIKADQVEKWVERIEADATMLDLLKELPDNAVLASELGSVDAADQANAAVQFDQKVNEAIKASEGKLSYADAVKQVAASNPQLASDRNKNLVPATK